MPEEQTSQPIGFDDIPALTDREIQMVIRDVETRDLAVALVSADEALKARIFGNVSARVRSLIVDEIEALGAPKEEVVQEGRLQVTRTLRQLKSAGLISWPPLKDYPVSADGAQEASAAPRRRRPTNPVKRRLSVGGLIGTLGGLVLLVLLLMWLASMQTKPTISPKKGARIAFGGGGGGARQSRTSKPRKQEEKDEEEASPTSGVSQTEGQVSVTSGDSERSSEKAGLQAGDRVETGDDGRAELQLPGETGQVQMEANSSVQMGEEDVSGNALPELNVRVGNILVRADKSTLTVRSPLMEVTASEGAVYRFRVVLDATTTVSVDRGTVWLKSLIDAEVDRLVAGPGDKVTISPKGEVVTKKEIIKMPERDAE